MTAIELYDKITQNMQSVDTLKMSSIIECYDKNIKLIEDQMQLAYKKSIKDTEEKIKLENLKKQQNKPVKFLRKQLK